MTRAPPLTEEAIQQIIAPMIVDFRQKPRPWLDFRKDKHK